VTIAVENPTTINEGARIILEESVGLLDEHLSNVVIIGGWGPFLRNQDHHPGTRDVDVLFPEFYDRDTPAAVIMRFLDKGYLVSAKHNFQILKPLRVGARKYLYNVDFLHPVIERTDVVEFEDVINLDVTIDGYIVKTVQTVCILRGDLVFRENLYTQFDIAGKKVPLLNDLGVVITKLKSCREPKRPRDIYDVVLAWKSIPDQQKTQLTEMSRNYDIVRTWLNEFDEFDAKNPEFFSEGLQRFSKSNESLEQNIKTLQDILAFAAQG
jgi:hypothetical protein